MYIGYATSKSERHVLWFALILCVSLVAIGIRHPTELILYILLKQSTDTQGGTGIKWGTF